MAHGIAEQIQAEQGWTDTTLLSVVLDYIENQGSDDAFADYLMTVAAGENEEELADTYDEMLQEAQEDEHERNHTDRDPACEYCTREAEIERQGHL